MIGKICCILFAILLIGCGTESSTEQVEKAPAPEETKAQPLSETTAVTTILPAPIVEEVKATTIGEIPGQAIAQATSSTMIGCGASSKEKLDEAIAETVGAVEQQLAGQKPQFAILFSTVGYNSELLVKAISARWGKECQIYGGTSCNGVLTRERLYNKPTGSMAILAIASPKIKCGVGGADMKAITARQAGQKAIEMAVANLALPKEKIKLVLITAGPGEEEEVIAGIETVIGKDIPIIGGSSADNTIEQKWRQFANDQVYQKGVAVAAIATDLNISWAYEMGYLKSEKGGKITKAEGRTIIEIDGRPAAEVYNEWMAGSLSAKLQTGGAVLSDTTLMPLAKVLHGKSGETHYLSIHPLSINLPERSLTVFANVQENDELLLLHGDPTLLFGWCKTTPSKAISQMQGKKPLFGIFVYCAGTMFALSEENRQQMPSMVAQELQNIPFIGIYSFGEQGFLPGVGNRHGNLINSTIVFSEN